MAKKRVLIAYGTRYGSAGIVAGDIQAFLEDRGVDVDLIDLGKDRFEGNLKDYDLVITGSSIAMFSWIGRVKRFLKKIRQAGVPAAVYICCGMAIDSPEKAKRKYLDKLMHRIGLKPVTTRAISPVIDFRPEQGLPVKLKKRISGIIQGMAKDRFIEDGLMDFRDKDRFRRFLEDLAGKL